MSSRPTSEDYLAEVRRIISSGEAKKFWNGFMRTHPPSYFTDFRDCWVADSMFIITGFTKRIHQANGGFSMGDSLKIVRNELNKLVKEGWLEKQPDPRDKRMRIYRPLTVVELAQKKVADSRSTKASKESGI